MEFPFFWLIQIFQASNEENYWRKLECILRIRSTLLFRSIFSHLSPTRFVANMNPRINNWPYRRIPLNYFLKICVFLDQQFLGVKTVSTEDSNFWCMIWVAKGFILFDYLFYYEWKHVLCKLFRLIIAVAASACMELAYELTREYTKAGFQNDASAKILISWNSHQIIIKLKTISGTCCIW